MAHETARALTSSLTEPVELFKVFNVQVPEINSGKQLASRFAHRTFRNGDELRKLSITVPSTRKVPAPLKRIKLSKIFHPHTHNILY